VVAVSMEVRIGDNAGMMNIGIPSIVVKMLRNKFDQQWSVRKSTSTEQEQSRILHLIRKSRMWLDGRLRGPTLSVANLIDLKEDDVLAFDFDVDRQLDLTISGEHKYMGRIVTAGHKRGFQIEDAVQP
jgi:flagellar motor switch protein FliM